MRFVLEEASWTWDGQDRDAYIERIELFLDRLDVARERREAYAASRELLEQCVCQRYALADLLFDPNLPLHVPFEVGQRISALFNSMHWWDDEMEWPAIETSINGQEVLSPSSALALWRVCDDNATACLPLPGTWTGPCVVTAEEKKATIHFVTDESTHKRFFRDTLELEGANEQGLRTVAPHAFPDLHFLEDVWAGLRHFEGGYDRVRKNLHRLLEVLDDHSAWVFTDVSGRLSSDEPATAVGDTASVTNQLIERRFKRWGVDVAPEKPEVRRDGVCRRARERVLADRTLYCEWHCKMEPHVNRVHIHPPVPESQRKTVVAIFCDHLPLP